MTDLRILHAPLHGPSAARRPSDVVDRIRQLRPHAVGLTEAYPRPVRTALRELDGYRIVLEQGGGDDRRGQYDVPVLVNDRQRSFGSGQVFGCRASEPEKLAPERWMTWAAFAVDGLPQPVCVICLHPHPVVQSKITGRLRTDIDRGLAFGEQMHRFARLLDFADAMGWDPIVVADINFRDRGDSDLSPYRLMRERRLRIHDRGIDLIAARKKVGLVVREVPAPRSVTNHPWLLGAAA